MNPNPWTPAEEDKLRALFGSSKLFSSSNSQFENILASINGLYDTDDAGATQAAIRSTLTQIAALEVQLQNLIPLMLSSEVESKIKVNAIKNDNYLRFVVGPALINQIAVRISFPPLIPYFSPASTQNCGQAIVHKIG
jgi:hypothetical protein